jgi:hypothetical protein
MARPPLRKVLLAPPALAAGLGLVGLASLPAEAAGAPSQLKAKALHIGDMPAGWSVDNSSTSGGPSGLTGCLTKVKAFNHSVKGVSRVKVSYTDGQFPALSETLLTGKSAAKQYATYTNVMSSCRQVSLNSDGTQFSGSIGAMSFPSVGDGTHAYAISLSAKGYTFGFDLVLFKVGSVVGDVVYADLGSPDAATVQAFVTEAVNKIQGKPATPAATAT